MISKLWLAAANYNFGFSVVNPSHKFLLPAKVYMWVFHVLSTESKSYFYFAIFCWISSDEKIGSKYIQPLWVLIQFYKVSWISIILPYTRLALLMTGLI